MPVSVKKDLYLGKSLHELNQLAADIQKITNARLYAKTAEKVYRGAEEAFLQGDEERSYVLYMKYFNIIAAIKKTAEYKKQIKFFEELIGKKNCVVAITKAEDLAASLKTRYEEIEAVELSKKLDNLTSRDDPVTEEDATDKALSSDNERKLDDNRKSSKDVGKPEASGSASVALKGGIDVQSLYRLLNDPGISVIMMDVRSSEDFQSSHILSDECISIPENAVHPGCTVSHVEKNLSAASLKVWRTRGNVDYVILFDWRCSASTVQPRSTLTYLKDALFKWDQETVLRAEPLILNGGYDDWLLCYPSLTTNPMAKCPLPSNGTASDLPSLDSIDYDVDLEFLQSPPPPAATPQPPGSPPQDNGAPASSPMMVTSRPGMPVVDRSNKPKPSTILNNSVAAAATKADAKDADAAISDTRIFNKIDSAGIVSVPVLGQKKTENIPPKTGNSDKYVAGASVSAAGAEPFAAVPTVDRSKKPAGGHQADHGLPPDSEDDNKMVDAVKKVLRNQEHEEMKSLMEIREAKAKEVKIFAEIMRKKKRMEEEMRQDEAHRSKHMMKKNEAHDAGKTLPRQQISSDAADSSSISSFEDDRASDRDLASDSGTSHDGREPVAKRNVESNDQTPVQLDGNEKLKEPRDQEVKRKDDEPPKEEQTGKGQTVEQERVQADKSKTHEQAIVEDAARKREREVEKQKLLEEELKREKEEQRLKQQQQEVTRREQLEKELREKEQRELREKELREKEQRELREKELKEKEIKQRELREKELKERELREKEEAKQRDRSTITRKDPSASGSGPQSSLPSGWEKRWDEASKKFYYVDHRSQKTFWDPPGGAQKIRAEGPGTVYKERLKDEEGPGASSPAGGSGGGLKRSHSSPNIAKMIQDEQSNRDESNQNMPSHRFPQVDRSIKPKPSSNVIALKTEVAGAKVRNLNPTWGSMGYGLTGLRNLGNTCYMNSTLQCLSNAAPLTIYFLTDSYLQDIVQDTSRRYKGEVASEYAVLIKAMWSGQYKALSPKDFRGVACKMNSMFASNQHQDSHELLEILMNGLNEDLNRVRVPSQLPEQNNDNKEDEIAAEEVWKQSRLVEDSIVVDLFRGQYKSTLTCLKCDKKSVKFESFMCLNLPIPSPTRCSLSDCLLHFSKEEKMVGDSRWYCPRCKTKQDATKRIVIWRLPPILIVHLERFYYQGIWRDKITANVDFPLDSMDMNRYISGPQKRSPYNLFGVSNHFGTLDGGHYTAYCKSPVVGKWYKFDDQDVSEISKADTKSSAAYLLFYTSMKMDQLKM